MKTKEIELRGRAEAVYKMQNRLEKRRLRGRSKVKRDTIDLNSNEMEKNDLKNVSADELEELLKQKRQEESRAKLERRDAYEGLRSDMIGRVKDRVLEASGYVRELFDFVKDETSAFYDVMKEYGRLRVDGQQSYTLKDEAFKIEVKTNRVKTFDERADVAASRLVDFLLRWIESAPGGADNPMYQLCMTLLERNKFGNFDYKSISKLYDMEERFNDEEYSEIMGLFKESNVIEGTATNYYFSQRDDKGVWRRVEINFNRL